MTLISYPFFLFLFCKFYQFVRYYNMYRINGNLDTLDVVVLPNIVIDADITTIDGYTLEFIDDETQAKYIFTGTWEVSGDFLKLTIDNSLPTLKSEKYYTMRIIKDLNSFVVYRDKAFVTTQIENIKYDNNKNEYIEADSGNNDYIVL